MTRRLTAWVAVVVAATTMAWGGFIVHNLVEIPSQGIVGLDSLLPTLIWISALVLWTLLAWAVINLVGGAISVLPLSFLPFVPEQTGEHYMLHGLYAATQLPLIGVAAGWLIRRRRALSGSARGKR